MRLFLVLGSLGAITLAACTPAPPHEPQAGGQSFARDMSAGDRAACTSAGGRIERRGRMGAEICVRPFADAGKACTDTAQCHGKCVSKGNAEIGAAAGQCQADDRLFGCYSEIKGGKAAQTICVD